MSSIAPAEPSLPGFQKETTNRPAHGVFRSTLYYLMETEVHTFSFSVAANAVLSFFPFMLLLMTLVRRVFHSQVMYDVVLNLLRDSLPSGQDFVIRNLNALVGARQRAQVFSLVMLLITSTGVFLPLEVALNRIWGFHKNRSWLGNQLMSLGLAFACGILALCSIGLTAENMHITKTVLHGHALWYVQFVGFITMKVCAILASIAIFFMVYWLLPNGKVPARVVLPAAIMMGLLSEIVKYVYILAMPWLNFAEVYGPFAISVSLIFLAYLSGMLLLTGAHLSARRVRI